MIVLLLLGLSTLATAVLLLRTLQVLRRYRYRQVSGEPKDLPSVSVCIPARNETHALAQCLERVLKSDYPKLEILVLDDRSSDDTSLIIKSFASAGVRFIPGTHLPDGWLGKNHAYQTLINEASGDILLFLDVDTTIRINTISQLVGYMQAAKLSMLSVLPRRTDIEHPSAVFNTLRYHWELLLGTKKSPPAASALWLIESQALATEGAGLHNYGMSVRPERHLARQIHRSGRYRYVVASNALGVGFEKRIQSQWETATRLYYPMSGRNPVYWAMCLMFVALLLVPVIILLSWQVTPVTLSWSSWLIIATTLTLFIMFRALHGPGVWRIRLLVWPLLVLQELGLIVRSFVMYQTSAVTWKGRNLTAQPVNHDEMRIDE